MRELIKVHGSPLEMGIEQGKMLSVEIREGWKTVLNYKPIQASKPALVPLRIFLRGAGRYAQSFLKETFEKFPDFADRFEGISRGADFPKWKLALIHLVEVTSADSARQLMGCSSIAVVPPRSDEPILAKNFDFVDDFKEFGIMRYSFSHRGNSSVEFTMSPSVGAHTGFNEAGLAITYNYGYSVEEPQKASLLTARVQKALNTCETVHEAVKIINTKPNPSAAIITIIDSECNAAAVELSPQRTGIVEPTDGVIFNANLYRNPLMKRLHIPFDATYSEKAVEQLRGMSIQKMNIVRTERLAELIARHDKIDVGIIQKILADHGDEDIPSENTICRHFATFSTHVSAIILPKSRKMFYHRGQPCRCEEWKETRL